MNVVLSSDFPSTSNRELLGRLRAVGDAPRVAWLTGNPGRFPHFPLAKLGFMRHGITSLECLDASDVIPALDRFDAIYLTGGDPLVFRDGLRRSGLDVRLREFASTGRLVFGASGGAMQLTTNVSVFRLLSASVEQVISTRSDFDGVGLVDFELLPHLNRHDEAFLEKVRRYSEAIPHDIVALADGAALLLGEGGVQCSGEGVRYSRGVRSDLANGFPGRT